MKSLLGMCRVAWCVALVSAVMIGRSANAQEIAPLVIVDSIVVGGTDGWDYVSCDAAARRLYISHSIKVDIASLDTHTVIGSIGNTPGVHGIAIDPAESRGFVSNGQDATVLVFDLKTLQTITRIRTTGKKPDAILYDKPSGRVFVFNGGSDNCTVIDARSLEIAGTIALLGAPEFAVSDGRGHVYVNIEDGGEVVCLDATSLSILARYSVAPAATPTGLAIDTTHRRLFVGGRNQKLVVMNAENGKVIASFPIGKGVDAVTYDAERHLIACSNKDGSIDLFREIDENTFAATGKLQTEPGAKTMTLDPLTHHLLVPVVRRIPLSKDGMVVLEFGN